MCRNVEENVFDCGVGEDEAEEEEAEKVVAAVPCALPEVPGIASKLGRLGCFVLGGVVREAEDESSSSAFGGISRVEWHDGGGCTGEEGGIAGRRGSHTGWTSLIGDVLAAS